MCQRERATQRLKRQSGEFGVYLVADGTNKPYRARLRAPGYYFMAAVDYLCRGHMLAIQWQLLVL